MRNAIVVGHTRGVAGAVEGCGYLAQRIGRTDKACRFLSCAEAIRKRERSPLFSFWIQHNESARTALQAALGTARYEDAVRTGSMNREEDVVNEAAAMLRELRAGTVPAA